MARYVDGYIIPLKKKNVAAYKKMAKLGCKVWMEHGALDYYECEGEDIDNAWGVPFTKLCKLKKDETLIFAFIVYKSKADRLKINKKVHGDSRMSGMKDLVLPFDLKRFPMGGFKVLVKG